MVGGDPLQIQCTCWTRGVQAKKETFARHEAIGDLLRKVKVESFRRSPRVERLSHRSRVLHVPNTFCDNHDGRSMYVWDTGGGVNQSLEFVES